MTENKPVIFIRHKLTCTDEILTDFWNKRLIALHYDDIESFDPMKYREDIRSKVTKAFNVFKECQEKGAIVAAVYSKINKKSILIGEIEKNTKIEFPKYDYQNKKLIFKTMQLCNAREIKYIDHPVLMATQPPFKAITHWTRIEEIVRHFYLNKELPDKVQSLSYGQLEVLCYEYLKRKNLIDSLLMPIGRNLLFVDIVGFNSNGNRISAQVTFADNKQKVRMKLKNLKESIHKTDKETELIFFAPQTEYIESIRSEFENIEIINIEDVYNFLKSDKTGMILIDSMLNR